MDINYLKKANYTHFLCNGGLCAQVEIDKNTSLKFYANGDVKAYFYLNGQQVEYVKDKENRGVFDSVISKYKSFIKNPSDIDGCLIQDSPTADNIPNKGFWIFVENSNWWECVLDTTTEGIGWDCEGEIIDASLLEDAIKEGISLFNKMNIA